MKLRLVTQSHIAAEIGLNRCANVEWNGRPYDVIAVEVAVALKLYAASPYSQLPA